MLYELYGLPVQSQIPLNGPILRRGKPAIRIEEAPTHFFKKLLPEPLHLRNGICYKTLSDGSFYIRFFGFFRFWVSRHGRKVLYQKIPGSKTCPRGRGLVPPLIFLQTNVLSFSLLKLGLEAFHASSIALGNMAAAFLGESGYGKSTLAASFMKRGFSLLTDDVLTIRKKSGRFFAQPGIAQIKLWPRAAKKILSHTKGPKMSPVAAKLILPLDQKTMAPRPCEIRVLYVLWPSFKKRSRGVRIRKLKAQDGAIALIKSSHNLVIQDPQRLRAQMLFASALAQKVPIRGVSFPMNLKKIPQVRDLLLKDISRVCGLRQKQKLPMAGRF